jgi:hypothetical protein
MITENEVAEWKIDPTTIQFMRGMADLEGEAMYRLSTNRDEDVRDEWLKGYIQALRDIQKADFEDVE